MMKHQKLTGLVSALILAVTLGACSEADRDEAKDTAEEWSDSVKDKAEEMGDKVKDASNDAMNKVEDWCEDAKEKADAKDKDC
ncbi:hypothetical protein [Gayadomonas joobiniege]|uniref:hypothetical protein n=1 Tax=Gayadomonas joobiniege TaxID=1234606 RepID=UPI00058D09E5|nr:hypothetical protein [Gayadomonas joobiniege]